MSKSQLVDEASRFVALGLGARAPRRRPARHPPLAGLLRKL